MNTIQQRGDEMVQMFTKIIWESGNTVSKPMIIDVCIAHCKRVIEVIMDIHSQMWGMPDAVRVTENEINNHRLILSELEGRVK